MRPHLRLLPYVTRVVTKPSAHPPGLHTRVALDSFLRHMSLAAVAAKMGIDRIRGPADTPGRNLCQVKEEYAAKKPIEVFHVDNVWRPRDCQHTRVVLRCVGPRHSGSVVPNEPAVATDHEARVARRIITQNQSSSTLWREEGNLCCRCSVVPLRLVDDRLPDAVDISDAPEELPVREVWRQTCYPQGAVFVLGDVGGQVAKPGGVPLEIY